MRAALVRELGRPPEVEEVAEPEPREDEVVLEVAAAALNPVDVAVADGRFYGGHPPLPYVPGAEAVGRSAGLPELFWVFGRGLGIMRSGTLAERVAVAADALVPVPDRADPALACAFGIAGIAGWLPLARRAPVRAGETVLVLGATGTVGFVAVQAARLLGAGRVVAAGRDRERLRRAEEVGADAIVALDEPDVVERLREACGGDGPTLVIDPLWGDAVVVACEAAAPGARIVHVGQSAGPVAPLPSRLVRGKQLDILGYSNFTQPHDMLVEEYGRLVQHATAGDILLPIERVPLEGLGDAWARQAGTPATKLVLVP